MSARSETSISDTFRMQCGHYFISSLNRCSFSENLGKEGREITYGELFAAQESEPELDPQTRLKSQTWRCALVERQRQVDSRSLTGQSTRSRPIRPVRDPILKKNTKITRWMIPKEWHLTGWLLTHTDTCMHMYTHIYKYTHARTCLGKGNVNRLPSDEHVLHNVLTSSGLDDVPILFPLITSFMSFQHRPLNYCRGLFYGFYVSAWKVMRNPDTCSNKSF